MEMSFLTVCVLCGVFAKENEQEVIQQAKKPVEFSANLFQEKLISGFEKISNEVEVISAPFVGSFPNASRIFRFADFNHHQKKYRYVPFLNIWGWRNISRAVSLKRALGPFIAKEDDNKLIVVYSAHTPFLNAAAYAKRMDSRIKVCLYVPDLPNYMNLSAKRGKLYDFAKMFDIAAMEHYMQKVDSFVLLTEKMKAKLPVANKPCFVAEGIMAHDALCSENAEEKSLLNEKNIVYTGKLDEKFGIKALVDGFGFIKDADCRLVLCGDGDCSAYVASAARLDHRIKQLGQVSPSEAKNWQKKAAVLVNPRPNNEEYTKYSFPSKNIEYILSGKPVVAYLLDGMPKQYVQFLHVIPECGTQAEAIAGTILSALAVSSTEQRDKYAAFVGYAQKRLDAAEIAKRIIEMSVSSGKNFEKSGEK